MIATVEVGGGTVYRSGVVGGPLTCARRTARVPAPADRWKRARRVRCIISDPILPLHPPGTNHPVPVSNPPMLSALETTLQDARFALRWLARNPAFSLTAILAGALGIGATSAVFSAVDRILFRPLSYA